MERGTVKALAGVAAGTVLAFVGTRVADMSVPFPVLVLGGLIGLVYGLLAVGLVLVYRTNKVINFAHGEVGAFAAAVLGVAVTSWHVPYWVAFVLALGLGGAAAAAAEVVVIRRLRSAPRLMSIVATLGVGQSLILLSALVNSRITSSYLFPRPPFLPEFTIAGFRVGTPYVAMLVFGPLLVVGLALFLKKTRYGIGIRSAAANAEAARMSGIFASRMSSLSWGLAGVVSAFTAIVVLPTVGLTSASTFGPSLLLRALAGGVVARMNSLPRALAAGVGLGVVEQVLLWNFPRSGFVELMLFAVILGALLFQGKQGTRDDDKTSWAAVQAWRPVPEALRKVWLVRNLGTLAAVMALAVAAAVPVFASNASSVTLTSIMSMSIVGLSVGILTGLGGQLSLGQFAMAGVGAAVSWHVTERTDNIVLGLAYAGVAAAVVALVVGLPSIRVRGLMLTVTTLSFALVAQNWLLHQPWALGGGRNPKRPVVFGNELETGREYYYFALAVLVAAVWLSRNVRRGGFGRLLVAIRDNEDAARAFTVRAPLVKAQTFLLAGFIAGVGGAVYGHTLSRIRPGTFSISLSIDVVATAVIGGISLLAGPIVGALYVLGVPVFAKTDQAALVASNMGWLLLILYVPGGLGQLIRPLRDRVVALAVRLAGAEVAAEDVRVEDDAAVTARAGASIGGLARVGRPQPLTGAGRVLLEATGLRKSFGGVTAVNDVSVAVRAGETLGLIGPNGAGKTTLFELLGGFTRPDRGTVAFAGRDVTLVSPEGRARLGLIRSFQDAALFPTMTVQEAVQLAFERRLPTSMVASALGFRGRERQKEAGAAELVHLMGLEAYRYKAVQELSTGTRRIAELACLVALEPSVLLLDEPSSGIAQRETEALGVLLRRLKEQLDLTLVIIEHDIPLIMGLADRIVAMDSGTVIADGSPAEVRAHPRVIEAYLGGSITAIERSGGAPAPATNGHRPVEGRPGLAGIPGVGPRLNAALLARFGSEDAVARASVDELLGVPGVGPQLAQRLHETLR